MILSGTSMVRSSKPVRASRTFMWLVRDEMIRMFRGPSRAAFRAITDFPTVHRYLACWFSACWARDKYVEVYLNLLEKQIISYFPYLSIINVYFSTTTSDKSLIPIVVDNLKLFANVHVARLSAYILKISNKLNKK